MTSPDEPRRRYNVGATKIPARRRTIAHAVLPTDDDWAQRGYRDIIGSDSDHSGGRAQFPYGAEVSYTVELTDAEAQQFAQASNLRYLEEDQEHPPARHVARPTGTLPIPTLATLGWLRARYVDLRRWHGRDVPVAVLDQGTTAAVRAAMGLTLVARTVTSGVTLGPGQELVRPDHSHGCLVAPNAVPAGGLLLDCVITSDSGGATDSAIAAGIRWAVDNGARVVNISFAGSPGGSPAQVIIDACAYARDNGGAQIVIATGNDAANDIGALSAASRLFAGVHSSVAFDEATDRRALFSNAATDASGCASGVSVTSLDPQGQPVRWNGTSASAPHQVQLMARALTGGQFTPAQVGAAFKANTRDTGAGAAEQGGGAYDLHRALTALGAQPAAGPAAVAPTHLDSRGGAATVSSWGVTPAAGVQVDDLQIVVLVSEVSPLLPTPHGWTLLADVAYRASYELAAGQPVSPTRVRVLAAPYTAAQPANTVLALTDGPRPSAMGVITVRGAGGMDPERFAPLVRFGTGTSPTTLAAQPATDGDLQLCVFSQLHPTATTATLSLPAGLTQRGFWRPGTGTAGYSLLIATRTVSGAGATPSYTSAANASGTWAALTLTVPGGDPEIAPVTQAEPGGPPGGTAGFLPHA